MQPRRRRAGHRPGQLSRRLRDALAAEAAHLHQIDDPLQVIDAVGDVFASLDDALAEISSPRLQAVARLRADHWSYDRIAAATQLSKGRVAQLAREASNRGM